MGSVPEQRENKAGLVKLSSTRSRDPAWNSLILCQLKCHHRIECGATSFIWGKGMKIPFARGDSSNYLGVLGVVAAIFGAPAVLHSGQLSIGLLSHWKL